MQEAYIDDEKVLELKDIRRILRKRGVLILSVWLGIVGMTLLFSILSPKVYQAETTLRLKQSKGLGQSLLAELPFGDPLATKQQLSTYIEIIKSRAVIEEVIRLTKQTKESRIDYETMLQRLSISQVRDTEILKIQARAPTPDEAQQVANLLVDVFLRKIVSMCRSEQTSVREFIAGRLKEAKNELAQSEKLLQEYKSRVKMVEPNEEARSLLNQLGEINKLVAQNQIEYASCQATLINAQEQLKNEKSEFVAENPLIQQCRAKLVEFEVEKVGLLQKYTENHPKVQALLASITETKQALNNEVSRVVNLEASSLNPIHQSLYQEKIKSETELAALSAQKKALDQVAIQGENLLTKLPIKEQGLARVMRDAMLAQEIYVMLAKRYEESRISEVMQPSDVQIVDRANAPGWEHPIGPNKRMNILIGAFLGLVLGSGLAFAIDFLNQTIIDQDDVRQYLGLPILGTIPSFDSKYLTGGASRFKNNPKC